MHVVLLNNTTGKYIVLNNTTGKYIVLNACWNNVSKSYSRDLVTVPPLFPQSALCTRRCLSFSLLFHGRRFDFAGLKFEQATLKKDSTRFSGRYHCCVVEQSGAEGSPNQLRFSTFTKRRHITVQSAYPALHSHMRQVGAILKQCVDDNDIRAALKTLESDAAELRKPPPLR